MEELISKEEYIRYVSEYESELKELEKQKTVLFQKVALQQDSDALHDIWAEAFKDCINVDTLTRDMVLELVEKIEVHDDGAITIYYKFQNPYAD